MMAEICFDILPLQAEEIETIEVRDKLTVSQWAEQRRIMSKKESRYDGPWSNSICPYLVEIMDSLSDLNTREVWHQKCAQSAGTEAGNNWVGQTVDEEPAPMSVIGPDENMVKKDFRTRMKPMFESTPSLRRHLKNGDIRNLLVGQETELDRMFLYMGWAGSPISMSSTPVQKIIIEEAAKCQHNFGTEATPFSLLRDRQKTFHDISKLYANSTPQIAGDMFDIEMLATDMRRHWVKCPFCGQFHIPNMEYLQMDKNSVGHLLPAFHYNDPKCSRYICPMCEKVWDDWKRWQAVQNGKWCPQDCRVNSDGKIEGKVFSNPKRGYYTTTFMIYPGFLTLSSIAHEWAAAQNALKSGNKGPLQNFINSWLGENWIEKEKETAADRLVPHIGTYKKETVPDGVQIITIGIDQQMDHVWYIVAGWGYRCEIWTIEEGRLETGDVRQLANWEMVEDLICKNWHLAGDDKQTKSAVLTAIDCGDQQEAVFDFCMKCQKQGLAAIPVKGSGLGKFDIYRPVKVRNDKLVRYDLNVNNIKNKLFRFMYETTDSGPSFWHLHSETSAEVREHLASEHLVPEKASLRKTNLVWQPKADHKPNHLWDAAVYATAAAEIAGVHLLRDPAQPRKKISLAQRQAESRRD
jgi:phage terminase large subunit GpA-like protein